MNTIKDYHDLYLQFDVLLLTDMFEKFRNNSIKNYGFCPNHYLSAQDSCWDPIIKMKKVVIKLIKDFNTNMFFEKR